MGSTTTSASRSNDLVALLGLRVAHRRILAQWTAIDFATAVALVTILAAHWIASLGRFHLVFGKLVDHRVRVLVHQGRLRHSQLRLCGLTDSKVLARLRQ
jgi:hypothetical protein